MCSKEALARFPVPSTGEDGGYSVSTPIEANTLPPCGFDKFAVWYAELDGYAVPIYLS